MLYVFSNDVIFWTRHKPISKCKVTNNSLNNCVFQAKTLIASATKNILDSPNPPKPNTNTIT